MVDKLVNIFLYEGYYPSDWLYKFDEYKNYSREILSEFSNSELNDVWKLFNKRFLTLLGFLSQHFFRKDNDSQYFHLYPEFEHSNDKQKKDLWTKRRAELNQLAEQFENEYKNFLKIAKKELENKLSLAGTIERTPSSFKETKFDFGISILYIGDQKIKITKHTRQYEVLRIIFKDREKDWQFSEIEEEIDRESKSYNWKNLYNIVYQIDKNVALATGIKDFFITTTQSVKINPKYIKSP